ncbi:Putative sigma-54 interaction domain, ATP-binding site 1 [Septoria linicola]|uniref:Sigma-54 interaction domain, ATP-binding site 1 n=1 Tax=Septoria linicola TaxID=215465 RepID=A0A9Q9EIX9_9PEZI|nr:Putative sigma-54 interaction domain, ATP-binding site 1 [Septoria linicola]
METLDQYRRDARDFGQQPLLVTAQGKVLDLKSGYIPLLSTFTHEDKAAKGLRKGRTIADGDVPVYYTAFELVRDNQVLLLHGESGSGKTTFGGHLCHRIVTQRPPQPTPVLRNESGQVEDEFWDTTDLLPCYFAIDDTRTPR